MSWKKRTYRDRFGNAWAVRMEAGSGKTTRISFTCQEFRLIAEADERVDQTILSSTRLKEFFCDAERVLEHGGEKWYVGFRDRTGRGGHTLGGTHTRFRSERGEVRYARTMVHFRNMPLSTLCRHLVAATPSKSETDRAS